MAAEYIIDWPLTGEVGEVIDELRMDADQAPELAHDLCVDFGCRQPRLMLLESYYAGKPPLSREPDRLTSEYKELLVMGRSNWCSLVVDVVNERLRVGSTVSSEDVNQDPTLWEWWQRNNMDGVSSQVHTTALKFGICYVSVWPGPAGVPLIMGESPLACYCRTDPLTNTITSAIRLWQGRDNIVYCDLTTPVAQYRLVSRRAATTTIRDTGGDLPQHCLVVDPSTIEWEFREDGVDAPIRRNTLGVVPYVALYSAPDLLGGFRSEFESIMPIQDRINKTIFDRLVTQEFAAFPQRAIAGIETFKDPDTGKVKLPFDAAADRIWTATSPDTRFQQFEASTGEGYLRAVEADIANLATQTRTPPHYLTAGMGSFPSGESVRATEFGLTRKVQARQQSYGDGWAELLRMGARIAGEAELADDTGVGVTWIDMEARSEGEIVDALLKMGTLGVPWQALWKRWGASPEEIAQWTEELDATLERSRIFQVATGTPTQGQVRTQLANQVPAGGDTDANPATAA